MRAILPWLACTMAALAAACDDAAPGPVADAGGTAFDAGADAATTSDAGSEPDGGPQRLHVTVQFEAKLGSEPCACDRTYPGVGTSAVEVVPRDLRVFVQDLALIRKSDGVEVPLELEVREGVQRTEVTLLDFEDNQGHCVGAGGTPEINTTVTGWIPAGEYGGVAFSNGVPESVNHQNPIDLTAPLVAGPLHWNWNGGFLFINAQLDEVRAAPLDAGTLVDAGGDAGPGLDDGGVAGSGIVHIGSTACSPNQGCQRKNRNRIVLPGFDHARDRIVLDVAAIFGGVDLREATSCHAVGVECEVFFAPLGLDYETGAPTTTQSIYRVE
jgi:uncharacterized repeat protein (TIGR04052 family)